MIYVLLVWFTVNSGATGFSQEFNTREACEEARIWFSQSDRYPIYRIPSTICIPKGIRNF